MKVKETRHKTRLKPFPPVTSALSGTVIIKPQISFPRKFRAKRAEELSFCTAELPVQEFLRAVTGRGNPSGRARVLGYVDQCRMTRLHPRGGF